MTNGRAENKDTDLSSQKSVLPFEVVSSPIAIAWYNHQKATELTWNVSLTIPNERDLLANRMKTKLWFGIFAIPPKMGFAFRGTKT